jgi:hypothetical protein
MFEQILLLPHDFIFNRDWYERFDGRLELEEYQSVASRLDAADHAELATLLSTCDPREFADLREKTTNLRLRRILPFYVPKPKGELSRIWERQRGLASGEVWEEEGLAEDERVEDAGLDDDDADELGSSSQGTKTGAAA